MTAHSGLHRVLAAAGASNFGSKLSRLAIPWLAMANGVSEAAAFALGGWFFQCWGASVALLIAQQLIGDAGQVIHEVHDHMLRQTALGAIWLARVDGGIRSVGQIATLALRVPPAGAALFRRRGRQSGR